MKTDGGYEIDEKDLEEMGMTADEAREPEEEAVRDGYRRIGACRFCGQMSTVTANRWITEEEADELATYECQCYEGKDYAKKKEQGKKAKQRIVEMFKAAEGEKTIDKRIEEILCFSVDILAEKKIESITIDLGKGLKAKISRTAKGNIKVERNETTKTSFEE